MNRKVKRTISEQKQHTKPSIKGDGHLLETRDTPSSITKGTKANNPAHDILTKE